MDDKKKHIVLAARDLFLSVGFASTSMEDAAKVAGMGKASIYHYFSSKEELFNEILTVEIDEMEAEMLAELKKVKSAEEKLHTFLKTKFSRIRNRYHQMESTLNLWKELGDQYHHVMMRFGQKEAEIIASIFVGGMTTGEFRQVDPLKLSAMMMTYFWGMQYSVYRQSCIDGFTKPDLDVAETNSHFFTDIMLTGIIQNKKQ